MSYQAAQRNFQVATGADNIFAVRFHRGGALVDASSLIVGDYVNWHEVVWPVFSTAPAGAGKTTLELGNGQAWQPTITLNDSDQLKAVPVAVWEAVDMQVALPDTIYSPPPTTLAVPTSLDEGGMTCQINIGQTWLEPFQAQIDYAEGGPSGMSLPYDLVGQFTGQRIRVLTGSIQIVRSAASPVVAPPVPPEVTP